MGYERNPRSDAGWNDDRDQHRNDGRDGYGSSRTGAANTGRDQAPGDRNEYYDANYGASYGDRAPRSGRDAGAQDQGGYGYGGGYGGYGQGGSGRGAYGTDGYGSTGSRDSNHGGNRDYGRPDLYGNRDRNPAGRQQGYGRQPQGYDYDERGFFDRAGDEVRSWFGDDEASRRRDFDARYDEQRYGNSSDDHYHHWRRSQIDALDRDYDEYRRENRTKFDSEFGSWRSQRQTQRSSLSHVTEHMDVVGSDGAHVGTVDKVRGDRIILTKNDADAGGRHHSIPSRWIQSVDDKVTISKTAEDAKAHWRDEERNKAFFNEDGTHRDGQSGDGQSGDAQSSDSPRVLGRSFSGTY